LYSLETKQKIYQIGNLKIGGLPGELPTVLIGNIFYKGMPEVSSHKEGCFDKKEVTRWIRLAETVSEQSGVPHLLDIMAMYPEAIRKYIRFVSEETDGPFLVDGANPATQTAALSVVEQFGLQDQVIFNGISPRISKAELSAIQQSKVGAAVILAYNETDFSPKGRISILKNSKDQIGLLDVAKNVGIERTLIDTTVFDVPSISIAAEAIKLVKEELGQPAGCSPANATYSWKQSLKESVLIQGFAASNASAHTFVQCWGADFLIYGPIKQAKNVIPACAINDAIIAYHAMKRFGTKPLVENHPLRKIF
jgi:tetrahydromethanopterin S-methyltransferase subunit H